VMRWVVVGRNRGGRVMSSGRRDYPQGETNARLYKWEKRQGKQNVKARLCHYISAATSSVPLALS
jgi:hypothetical protein